MKTRIAIACIGLCIGTTANAGTIAQMAVNDAIQVVVDVDTGVKTTNQFTVNSIATVYNMFENPQVEVNETPVAYADRNGATLVKMVVPGKNGYVYCVQSSNIHVDDAAVDVKIGAGTNAGTPLTDTGSGNQCAANGKSFGLQIKGNSDTKIGSWPITVVFDAYGV